MHEVHGFQARHGQKGACQHIDATGAHLLLGARPGPSIDHLDADAEILGHRLEQIDRSADQLFRILRVTPQVRRILGVARGDQPLALAGGLRATCQQHGSAHP